ncbi:MAG: SAM-dependent methyltransferase [Xenococcaceae cyanobacterium]
MSFKLLKNVVPWGRSGDEYIRMFNLTKLDLKSSIVDCAGGPSSFNAEMTISGYKVISCDPIYQFTANEIAQRIQETYPVIMDGLKANLSKFVWRDVGSPEQLGQIRMSAMNKFLDDFPLGVSEGRYVTDELPHLSFRTGQFDLALCSHFLFTYSEQLSLNFHLASLLEMCRVAKQVRVFPLLENFTGEPSPFLEPVKSQLSEQGYRVEIEQVSYEFQENGNKLLHIYPN